MVSLSNLSLEDRKGRRKADQWEMKAEIPEINFDVLGNIVLVFIWLYFSNRSGGCDEQKLVLLSTVVLIDLIFLEGISFIRPFAIS